jgi:hypothetical protein
MRPKAQGTDLVSWLDYMEDAAPRITASIMDLGLTLEDIRQRA